MSVRPLIVTLAMSTYSCYWVNEFSKANSLFKKTQKHLADTEMLKEMIKNDPNQDNQIKYTQKLETLHEKAQGSLKKAQDLRNLTGTELLLSTAATALCLRKIQAFSKLSFWIRNHI